MSIACCAVSVEQLRHRGQLGDLCRAGVVGRGRGSHELPRRLDSRRHLGERVRDRLELTQRLTEGTPLRRMGDRRLQRCLRHADRAGADARPKDVQRPHRDPEAVVDLTEHRPVGHRDTVELRVPIGCGEMRSRCRPPRPTESPGTTKAVSPREPAPGVVRAKHRVDVRLRSIRDPLLDARQAPAAPVALCDEADRRDIRAGLGSVSAKAETASPGTKAGTHRWITPRA